MRKTRWFAVLIFLLLFSTCNAFAEEVRQSRVNQVSVTYQMKNRKWGFIDILTGYNSGPQYDDIYDDCYESDMITTEAKPASFASVKDIRL